MKKFNWRKAGGLLLLVASVALTVAAIIAGIKESSYFAMFRILFWDIFLIPWGINIIRKENAREKISNGVNDHATNL
jgi:hypothetical protein